MKKRFFNFFAIAILFSSILQTSCNDASSIGGDLLEQDQLNVALIDTFKIQTSTVREDSVLVLASDNPNVSYPIGILEDPIYGSVNASVYFEVSPYIISPNLKPSSFSNAVIDSVVMSLQYDSTAYGDLSSARSLEVYRLNESITATLDNITKGNVYATQSYKTDATPLGVKNNFTARIKPRKKDSTGKEISCDDCVSVTAFNYNTTKMADTSAVLKLDPHLRVQLDKSLGTEIFALDSTTLNDNTNFRKVVKGFYLKPTSKNAGLINFLLTATSTSTGSQNLLTNITIYYRDKTNDRHYRYIMYADPATVKVTNFKHDFSQNIKDAFASTSVGDSILFLQGLNGPNVKVTLPTLGNLKNNGIIVNKAELEFYSKITNDGFSPAAQLVLVDASNGKGALISDASLGYVSSFKAFGGKPVAVTINGEKLNKYTFNLSNYAQSLIDNSNALKTFYITTNGKQSRATRTILYGAKHSKYKPQLKLHYTKVK